MRLDAREIGRAFVSWTPRSPAASVLRTVLVMVAIAVATMAALPSPSTVDGDPSSSLAALVADRYGLIVDPGSVHWIDPPGSGIFNEWYVARATLLARTEKDALRDLYLVHTRIAPGGRVLSARTTNLTNSFNAADRAVMAMGPHLMLGSTVDEAYTTLTLYDFRGEDPGATQDWPAVEKLKNRITNRQKTGQGQGVHVVRYEIVRPSEGLAMAMEDGHVVATLDSGTVRIATGHATPVEGEDLVVVHEPTKAISGHVAWMVDTVRANPLIGKEKIGWLEAKFYNLKDVFMRGFYGVAGDRYAARALEEDLGFGEDEGTYEMVLPEALGEMDIGWPPPPVPDHPEMDPMDHEGEWKGFTDERFTRHDPGHPHPLYTTFIRPDPDRSYANITMVAWDPRMVEIHMQAGVVEPISDTGKAGTGMIPRDDETMMRLLGAFNGGFQALHGEFGMMQDGKVYLPPKPWAATVAFLKGGRTGFGTWPGPEPGEIPPEILDYRQNLTPLMADGVVNPYRRHWWGSSPDLNPDSPKINRSGICWTEDGHILYGLARSVDEYGFADGFKRAGCHYLIQLDVNSGHSGFEYYRVDPRDAAPALEEPLDKKSEAEGEVRDRPDLVYRAKKLFKSMVLMRFPRFIQRDPRDYIYITLARLLPGPDVVPPGGGDPLPWKAAGLPGSTTYPARFTMVTMRGTDGYDDPIHVVQMDPRWSAIEGVTGTAENAGAVWYPPVDLPRWEQGSTVDTIEQGDHVIAIAWSEQGEEWVARHGAWIDEVKPDEVGWAFRVLGEDRIGTEPVCGAFGLGPHRFVTWAETTDGDASRLAAALHAAGAETVLAVPAGSGPDPCGWAFVYEEGDVIPLVHEVLAGPGSTRWGLGIVLTEREPVVRLFPDTTVVEPRVWNPPHTKRVRYFRKESTDEDGDDP